MKQLWYWGSLNSTMNRSTARTPRLRSSPLGAIVRWTWLLWVTCNNAMGPGCWWPTSMPMQISMRSGKRLPGTSMAAWQLIGFGQFFLPLRCLNCRKLWNTFFLKWPLPYLCLDIGQCALKRSHLSYSDESKSASGTKVASHALCSQVSIRFGNVSKLASCNFTPSSIFMRAFPKMGAKSAGHFSSTLPILGYAPHFGQKTNYKNIHNKYIYNI